MNSGFLSSFDKFCCVFALGFFVVGCSKTEDPTEDPIVTENINPGSVVSKPLVKKPAPKPSVLSQPKEDKKEEPKPVPQTNPPNSNNNNTCVKGKSIEDVIDSIRSLRNPSPGDRARRFAKEKGRALHGVYKDENVNWHNLGFGHDWEAWIRDKKNNNHPQTVDVPDELILQVAEAMRHAAVAAGKLRENLVQIQNPQPRQNGEGLDVHDFQRNRTLVVAIKTFQNHYGFILGEDKVYSVLEEIIKFFIVKESGLSGSQDPGLYALANPKANIPTFAYVAYKDVFNPDLDPNNPEYMHENEYNSFLDEVAEMYTIKEMLGWVLTLFVDPQNLNGMLQENGVAMTQENRNKLTEELLRLVVKEMIFIYLGGAGENLVNDEDLLAVQPDNMGHYMEFCGAGALGRFGNLVNYRNPLGVAIHGGVSNDQVADFMRGRARALVNGNGLDNRRNTVVKVGKTLQRVFANLNQDVLGNQNNLFNSVNNNDRDFTLEEAADYLWFLDQVKQAVEQEYHMDRPIDEQLYSNPRHISETLNSLHWMNEFADN